MNTGGNGPKKAMRNKLPKSLKTRMAAEDSARRNTGGIVFPKTQTHRSAKDYSRQKFKRGE